jgi:hypothetical protein
VEAISPALIAKQSIKERAARGVAHIAFNMADPRGRQYQRWLGARACDGDATLFALNEADRWPDDVLIHCARAIVSRQTRWRTVASRERQSVAPVSLTTRAGTINPMSPRAAKARSCCDQMDCLTKNNSVETIATADQASSLQMCHPSA